MRYEHGAEVLRCNGSRTSTLLNAAAPWRELQRLTAQPQGSLVILLAGQRQPRACHQLCSRSASKFPWRIRIRVGIGFGLDGLMQSPDLALVSRRPRRISVTLADSAYRELLNVSDLQGRSASNLAAYLLECGLQSLQEQHQQDPPRRPFR